MFGYGKYLEGELLHQLQSYPQPQAEGEFVHFRDPLEGTFPGFVYRVFYRVKSARMYRATAPVCNSTVISKLSAICL
jgi:hypothetical protein